MGKYASFPENITVGGKTFELLTLDFETYYSATYSLRLGRYNTTQYIRSPEFKAHGVGIIRNGSYHWIRHEDIPFFFACIPWEKTAVVMHNALFDASILAEHYKVFPAFHIDSAAMSRLYWGNGEKHTLDALAKRHGLEGKVRAGNLVNTKGIIDLPLELWAALGEYCEDDCSQTLGCFIQMYEGVPDTELKLIDLTTRLFTRSPLIVNQALAREEADAQKNKKTFMISRSHVAKEDLMSNPRFAQLLTELGVDPPLKTSPRTGKETYAFAASDAGFVELLDHANPIVAELAEARATVKSTLHESRAERMIECSLDGKNLPVGLTYAAAKTHRWGGTNKLNLQNLPRVGYLDNGSIDPDTARLRRAIEAPEGHVIVVSDLSQIEVRVLAWWCGQTDLLDDFANKVDIYKKMASRVYDKPTSAISKTERFVGKVLVLGLGYGMGAYKLSITLTSGAMGKAVFTTETEALIYVNLYRNTYAAIPRGWKIAGAMLDAMCYGGTLEHKGVVATKGKLSFPNGTTIHYKGLHWDDESQNYCYFSKAGKSKIYGALLVENIIQKLARDVIGEQLIEIDETIPEAQIVMTTHDEISAVTKQELADSVLNKMYVCMKKPPAWMPNVPLDAEGGWAKEYSK